jgi:N-acetylglutamate synthase-like GNAT family acetyltransferase
MNIKIRKAEIADIPYILLIEKLADISNIIKGRSNDKLEKLVYNDYSESLAYFKSKFETSEGYLVIFDESIIGCGFLLDQNKSYIIQTVYIEPSFQGQGIGTQLMKFLIGKARESRKEFMELETATAEGFYHRLGFVDIPDSFKMVLNLN